MRRFRFILYCIIIPFVCSGQIYYAGYDSLLQEVVIGNTINYKSLLEKKDILSNFTEQLGNISPDSHPQFFQKHNQQLTYWINAYNAFILKKIVDNYPVKSIKDINFIGFTIWLDKNIIGGNKISFKSLEDDIIRDRFQDPRIHFAINCASLSCPPLLNRAFLPDLLNDQLEATTYTFINDSVHFKVNEKAASIQMSAIFDWYEDDFLHWLSEKYNLEDPHILDYIKIYYGGEFKKSWREYEIEYNDYDWSLNDLP